MYNTLVTSTNDNEVVVSETGTALSWEILTDVLLRDVSAEAAALFSEPVADPARGVTQWFVDADEIRPLAALGGYEKDALLAKLSVLQDSIFLYADGLSTKGGRHNERLAMGLRAALTVPDLAFHLWSADGAPLLTAWGHGAHTLVPLRNPAITTASPNRIVQQDHRSRTEDSTPPHVAEAGGVLKHSRLERLRAPVWLLFWLAFSAIVASILYLLVPACAISLLPFPASPNYCSRGGLAVLEALYERNDFLRQALRDAEQKAAGGVGDCKRPYRNTQNPHDKEGQDAAKRLHDADVKQAPFDVTLIWNGREDLDLHVYCPGGGHIFHAQKTACGGTLDADQNSANGVIRDNPVEHVGWPTSPPPGDYRVVVVFFGDNGQTPRSVPFTVIVHEGGQERRIAGHLNSPKEQVELTTVRR